jgi:hypothetical protein
VKFLVEKPDLAQEIISRETEKSKDACSMNSLIARLSRMFYLPFYLVVVLIVLSSCSGDTSTATAPPVWKNYQGSAFTLSYLSNWEVATKDVYPGSRYPQLEMLQGTAFVKQANATSFLQVAYAARISSATSAKDGDHI